MLGRNHGSIGLATYAATVAVATSSGWAKLSVTQMALGGLVAVGASLAPDLDEDESTPGRAVPISAVLPIFGGHRTRTHTFAAAGIATAGTYAVYVSHSRMALAILVGVACAMGSGRSSLRSTRSNCNRT